MEQDPPPPYSQLDGSKPFQDDYGYGYPGAYTSANTPSQTIPMQQQHCPQQQPQQQQQSVVIVAASPPPTVAYNPYPVSMTGAYMFSCIVFWLFGWLFGLLAFILALCGSDASSRGDIAGARCYRSASYALSIIGLVIGVIAIGVLIWWYTTCYNNSNTSCGSRSYNYYG